MRDIDLFGIAHYSFVMYGQVSWCEEQIVQHGQQRTLPIAIGTDPESTMMVARTGNTCCASCGTHRKLVS